MQQQTFARHQMTRRVPGTFPVGADAWEVRNLRFSPVIRMIYNE